MISLAYFLIFGIRTVTISAWYLPWLQWSFPDDDEKEPRSDHVFTLSISDKITTGNRLEMIDNKM